MEIDYSINSHKRPCPRVNCRKEACICGLKYVSIPSVLGDDSPKSGVAPKKGEYCNAIVKYEVNDHIYIYSKEGIPTLVEEGNISKKLEEEIEARIAADAVAVAQGNTLAITAPTTSTVGVLGQLYTDTTNMHTYQCTAISGSTYIWTQRW